MDEISLKSSAFLSQSIGIDEINIYQFKFFSSMKIVGPTGLAGFLALEWA